MKTIKLFWMQRLLSVIVLLSAIFSCNGPNQRTDTDTPEKGTIYISVDESFKPVIDSQIQVFEALFPGAKVVASYKPEAECFKDLAEDSTRMIIVTRGLNAMEEKFYKDSLKYSPTWSKVANDAISLIVNNKSKDTLITMAKLKGILDGTTADKEIAVFDGLSATSTVRYAVDSILKGKLFDPKKVFAAKNSQGVINYVAENTNDNEVKIFPNPASHYFYFNTHNATATLQLFSASGSKLEQFDVGSQIINKIDISEYPSGVYYLKYENAGKSFTKKLMIQN